MKTNQLLATIALFLCLPFTALAQGNNTGMGGEDDLDCRKGAETGKENRRF